MINRPQASRAAANRARAAGAAAWRETLPDDWPQRRVCRDHQPRPRSSCADLCPHAATIMHTCLQHGSRAVPHTSACRGYAARAGQSAQAAVHCGMLAEACTQLLPSLWAARRCAGAAARLQGAACRVACTHAACCRGSSLGL